MKKAAKSKRKNGMVMGAVFETGHRVCRVIFISHISSMYSKYP